MTHTESSAAAPSSATRPNLFADLGLPDDLLGALAGLGYETPTPVQAEAIPELLTGRDLLGHAPTGTGKTAAFALPLLARIDTAANTVHALVLTPTRELAIQVAEAFHSYAQGLRDFHVLPLYGGQPYHGQISALRRGVQVVVGTPGRVKDHLSRGTLVLDSLQALVLDEADEMLRMGFIDDVEWILERTPESRQTALFSATMPREIERIARRHLRDPATVAIKARAATAETVRQRAWIVSGMHKLDALTRILEVETFDAILVFVRTRSAAVELADKLSARGFRAAALNGDMPQRQREQTVGQLKAQKLDILVATDVAARGLDVARITHVINYDIPYDTESYIHRIGRTGRAGRTGEAILFAAPRERRMLNTIERATRSRIEPLTLPSIDEVNNRRIDIFKQRIIKRLGEGELDVMRDIVAQLQQEQEVSAQDIAAALAHLSLNGRPLLLDAAVQPTAARARRGETRRDQRAHAAREGASRFRSATDRRDAKPGRGGESEERGKNRAPAEGFELFRIEVGHDHGVQPGNIVGAIANEAGLDAQHIGRVAIRDAHSEVELPEGMPREIFQALKKAWVCGQQLRISRATKNGGPSKTRSKTATKTASKAAAGVKKGRAKQRANKGFPKRSAGGPRRKPQRRDVKSR
ncbi:MAG: DEAD/DEAH box helicase [Pseudomonadota bacterium]